MDCRITYPAPISYTLERVDVLQPVKEPAFRFDHNMDSLVDWVVSKELMVSGLV